MFMVFLEVSDLAYVNMFVREIRNTKVKEIVYQQNKWWVDNDNATSNTNY